MKSSLTVLALVGGLSFVSAAAADCIGHIPRFVEMRVESCTSASPLARSAIEGQGYTDSQRQMVELTAQSLFVIRATPLAAVDMLEWYSDGDLQRYRWVQKRIQGDIARDYLAVSYGRCEALQSSKPLLFDVNPDTPCHDVRSTSIDGREFPETDARLLLELPLVSLWDDETIEDMDAAHKRMRAVFEKRSPQATR
jgi:hypothetical protein